jgi:general L-amino acid transport system permease protein
VAPLIVPRWLRRAPLLGVLGLLGAVAVLAGLGPLENIPTEFWGGFFLNVLIGVAGMMFSLPIGVLLALGRRSKLPVIKGLCVAFIEFVRGVPLITLLFMASVMLPLFAPAGASFDLLARALVVITLFSSAYLAEAVRGGLQAVPYGQREAARALGLGPVRTTLLVVLPQALRISIPAIVNSFIGLFKDTTLLFVIALLDVMGVMRQALADYAWQGVDAEGYAFVGLVFFLACFGLSRWSAALERRRDRRPELERPLTEPA